MKPPPIHVHTTYASDHPLTPAEIADNLLAEPPAVAVERAWRAGYTAGSWTSFAAGALAASVLFIVAAVVGWWAA